MFPINFLLEHVERIFKISHKEDNESSCADHLKYPSKIRWFKYYQHMEGVVEPDQEPAQDSPQSLLGSDFENVFDVSQFVSKNDENHEDKVH